MISTVTNRGRLTFMVFKERFTGTVMIKFLRRLIKQNRQKVFLIIDGHPVHRSRQVKRWMYKNRKRIQVFYLPGYSPQLNPDELLNQDVKTNCGRSKASARPAENDAAGSVVPAKYATPTQGGQKLFSA